MNLTRKEFKRICKDTVEIETDITADDKISKITNGGGDRGTQYAIKNENNKQHKKVM